jgi:uncharacterized protein YoxC
MFFEHFKTAQHVDRDIDLQEREIEVLAQQMNMMKRKTEKLFASLGIPPEEIETYFENPDNFTEDAWKEFQQLRKEIKEDAQRLNANMQSPQEKQESYKSFGELRNSYAWIRQ